MGALIAAVLVGYVIGAVNPAILIARAKGVDLRSIGSGNPGASNAGRALGRRTGVLIAILDVAKGAVPAACFDVVDHRAGLVAGLAAVLGHVTSPFLKGRGGKGVATAAGAVLGVHPLWVVFVIAMWVLVLVASRWIALASILASLSVPAVALLADQDVWWAAVLAGIVLVRHTGNVYRRVRPTARDA